FLIEKNKDNFIFFDFEYKVYSLRKWSKYLENTPYQVKKYVKGKKCFLKEGNFCWEYTLAHALSLVSKRNIIVLALAVMIIITLITLLYNKLEQQRLEDQKRKLALQVLTHEFRTPVASLLLLSEQFQTKLDLIPDEDTQELFLRLSSDVHRLHRLVESSNNYLKLQSGKKLVAFKFKKIPSINSLFENMLGPYLDQIEFQPLEKDTGFVLDEYWSLISVKNLVENALNHGMKPVVVKLKMASESEFHIIVTDAGYCEFQKLSEITAVFAKGKQSEGTGLGMNIVSKVIKDMDGELLYSRNPTTFTIILKNQKEKNGKVTTG
ncbi:MAG: DUF3404 domain-containing protein, partial [Bacteriovoracaceae bacterium]|nr:DUF3404 domain-containing protein [Bacteriovoracaceae bacterium]